MIRSILAVSLLLFSTHSLSADGQTGTMQITGAWSRALPPVAPTGAIYLSIENRGEKPERLIDVSTTAAERAEIHEHVHADGVMRMQRVESVLIEPGRHITFSPGGHHIMLFGLQQPLVDGAQYPITLRFDGAGEVEVEVQVMKDAPDASHHPQPASEHHH
jgi:periplasmic copper chaperone A